MKKLLLILSLFCIPSVQAYHQRLLISSSTRYIDPLCIPSIYAYVYEGDRLKLLRRSERCGTWIVDSYDSAYLELLNDNTDSVIFKVLKEGETVIELSFKPDSKKICDDIHTSRQKVDVSIHKNDPEARAIANQFVKSGCTYRATFCTIDDALDIQSRYPSLQYYQVWDRWYTIKIPSDFASDLLENLKKEKIRFESQTVRSPYIFDLLTNDLRDSLQDEIDLMINAIPASNHYSESTVIFAKVNEPFVITLKDRHHWNIHLTDEQKKYFSSIIKLEKGTTNFILTPSQPTAKPFFFKIGWYEEDITMVYPPLPPRTFSIQFAIVITQ